MGLSLTLMWRLDGSSLRGAGLGRGGEVVGWVRKDGSGERMGCLLLLLHLRCTLRRWIAAVLFRTKQKENQPKNQKNPKPAALCRRGVLAVLISF